MEIGKLNVFYISSDLKVGDTVINIASAFLTNAIETEFKDLLDNYVSDNKYNNSLFMSYVAQNGYYCTVLDKEVLTPTN